VSWEVSPCEIFPLEFFGKFLAALKGSINKLFNNNNNNYYYYYYYSTEADLSQKSQWHTDLFSIQNIHCPKVAQVWMACTYWNVTIAHSPSLLSRLWTNGEHDKLFFQFNLILMPRTPYNCNITSTKHRLIILTTGLLHRQATATMSKPYKRTKYPWVWHERKTGSLSSSACYTLNRNRVFCIPRGS